MSEWDLGWSAWKIGWWAVATFGVVGTIALLVLGSMYFPDLLRRIVSGFIRIFTFVLSYRIGCAIVAAVAVGFMVDYWRHSTDDAEFAQRTALFEHAQKARDERIRTETRDLVWIEIADQTAANAVTDNEVKEFHDALPPVPHTGNPFRVGPAAAKLRHIAGQAERQSGRLKRVSAPRPKGRG